MILRIVRADLLKWIPVDLDFLLILCANSFLRTACRSETLEKQSNKVKTMTA